ncbi:hypothetical protein [Niallia sp. NCCP-28]|uniref:hypothetical protein n=1 Tax=Niallia sp. NCCP-28 TaxID=2934712 RepID=UPI0020819F2F|nr:hypothetical protein [Niallia sp. NCCP-28]GKU83900.1 hypothetical protein NCCP28_32960 [Niallia sp. NCCP-28]
MNTFTGPFRLMMKEMNRTFYINAVITFVLFVFFSFLGFIDAKSVSFTLFGPFFIVFLLYPFINFKGYHYILSLGGTRIQFVSAIYLSTFIFSVISVLLLNLFYYLSTNIISSGSNSVNFFHLADLVNSSNWLVYLWVDFSWIIFLFSLGMIAKTIWFNYGTLFSLVAATLLLIIGTSIVVFGDISWLIELIFMHHLQFVNSLFGLSVVFLLSSYLLMINAPLEKGDRLILQQKGPKTT